MIYTLTFAPSIDVYLYKEKISENKINHINNQVISIGGKGINVSTVLNTLGIKSTAITFVSEEFYNYFDLELNKRKIKHILFLDKSITRVNTKVIEEEKETSLNYRNCKIDESNLDKLKEIINKLKSNDYLIISGHIPSNVSKNYLEELLTVLNKNNVNFILDISNKYLLDLLKYKPLMIKPNFEELRDIFKFDFECTKMNLSKIEEYSKQLNKMGVLYSCITLGEMGSMITTIDKTKYGVVKEFEFINSIGCGDSFVAGFIYSYLNDKNDLDYIINFSNVIGAATANSDRLADIKMINKIAKLNHLKIKRP